MLNLSQYNIFILVQRNPYVIWLAAKQNWFQAMASVCLTGMFFNFVVELEYFV